MSFPTIKNQNLQLSGSSNERGPDSLQIQPLDLLSSRSTVYQFSQFWFEGTFSKIAKCTNTKTHEFMAIKILKKRASECEEPNREVTMLKKISGLNPANIVRFFENFEHKGYTCLVLEMLDMNLQTLLNERYCKPFSLQEIRPVAQQLLSALNALKTAGVIHTQIKPSNIMLVNQDVQPVRVKLIDFGSAVMAADVEHSSITQPFGYRSPDVILGLPISEAIDMWSLGAILATMYLGRPLFPQRCQYYLMKSIEQILGLVPNELLNKGTNTKLYFKSTKVKSSKPSWRLRKPKEYRPGTVFPPERCNVTELNSLYDLVMMYPDEGTYDDKMTFVSFVGSMLYLNPQYRATPSEALAHLFITSGKPNSDAASFNAASPGGEMVTFSAEKADTEPDEADQAAVPVDSDSVPADDCTRTTNARSRPLKRIQKYFGRMFRAVRRIL